MAEHMKNRASKAAGRLSAAFVLASARASGVRSSARSRSSFGRHTGARARKYDATPIGGYGMKLRRHASAELRPPLSAFAGLRMRLTATTNDMEAAMVRMNVFAVTRPTPAAKSWRGLLMKAVASFGEHRALNSLRRGNAQ